MGLLVVKQKRKKGRERKKEGNRRKGWEGKQQFSDLPACWKTHAGG